jgi:ankyrin repeat protein
MVKHAANPNQRLFDLCGQNKLSAKEVRAEAAKLLAANPKILNATDDHGNTPLICALKHGKVGLAKQFITLGADVDAANDRGQTPLIEAAAGGMSKICAMLLERQADHNECNAFGTTALMAAIDCGHNELCTMLLPCDVLDARDGLGVTALHMAFFRDDLATCRVLLENGATMWPSDWELNGGLIEMSRSIERLLSRPRLAKRDVFESKGRIKTKVLFAIADRLMWAKLFAILKKDWSMFEAIWEWLPHELQERLKSRCAGLREELESRALLKQL